MPPTRSRRSTIRSRMQTATTPIARSPLERRPRGRPTVNSSQSINYYVSVTRFDDLHREAAEWRRANEGRVERDASLYLKRWLTFLLRRPGRLQATPSS